MIPADVKSKLKQQIKDLVTANYYKKYLPLKLQIQFKKGVYFSFDFGWDFDFVC